MTESQNKQIARHLKDGKRITSLEALRLYGCLRLSGRIHDLRRDGLNIETRMIDTLTGKRIAEYYIRRPNDNN